MRARGKFLHVGGAKFYVKGVTYGTFRPDEEGVRYPDATTVDRDFALMSAYGFNAVRTYTPPPRWLLDRAALRGLRVMVGLPWAQHVAFLDDPSLARQIRRDIVSGVERCLDHPAVLAYAIGNEIPAPIVRWHGRRRVQDFVETLYREAKARDPEALFTYVNYPTTEYLELPFLEVLCFNVFLEARGPLEAYLARLQNLAGERPVLMTEIGLDSRRNGRQAQAETLDWQVRSVFSSGCAGAFVFSWTDEWHRGDHDVEDWDFGLTTREREPKPALHAVSGAFADAPLEPGRDWPPISVVVCTYNGAETIDETLTQLRGLDYPDYEVIVVNDGSSDATEATLRRHREEWDVRVIHQENRGLSAARNVGWEAATGEIVAYIDDDAYPDPDWLTYVASTFREGEYAGVGGPNVIPPTDDAIAHCVAGAPGGPTHVLLDDREAEHIPGCNMAFRRSALEEIGGFDPRFRAAGDDVDLCWRIRQRGWKIGFHPGAMVWHHRRRSLRAYWTQQVGYGKAEALLEEKWPEKYNSLGHVAWSGRIYGSGLTRALLRGSGRRIYEGMWGTAPFQSVYERSPGTLLSLPLTPEWFLLVIGLAALTVLGTLWPPFELALPLLVLAAAVSVTQAVLTARDLSVPRAVEGRPLRRWLFRGVVTMLHVVQPLARLWGRLKHGLTPWRQHCPRGWLPPRTRERQVWSETWRSVGEWLGPATKSLREQRIPVMTGGDFDRWDLEVRAGMLGAARLLFAVEEHGEGKQMGRFRMWPRLRKGAFFLGGPPSLLSVAALSQGAWLAGGILAAAGIGVFGLAVRECGRAEAALAWALEESAERWSTTARSEGVRSGPGAAER